MLNSFSWTFPNCLVDTAKSNNASVTLYCPLKTPSEFFLSMRIKFIICNIWLMDHHVFLKHSFQLFSQLSKHLCLFKSVLSRNPSCLLCLSLLCSQHFYGSCGFYYFPSFRKLAFKARLSIPVLKKQ